MAGWLVGTPILLPIQCEAAIFCCCCWVARCIRKACLHTRYHRLLLPLPPPHSLSYKHRARTFHPTACRGGKFVGDPASRIARKPRTERRNVVSARKEDLISEGKQRNGRRLAQVCMV
ncbi:hypothetical protein BZA05DRAFT_201433 [Tricharina praecox]|uniref:uncharacterized protein n=1 Tax=Tricharina praecox TaxID=43433 RepID=UPI002220DF49|nr:uncharacterized protein BZA05DRAFT_201433 [Tricharina praecox]KAI5856461.1 hypothetical protein BZA05DRAFT_201433 [Tricharina praecox]